MLLNERLILLVMAIITAVITLVFGSLPHVCWVFVFYSSLSPSSSPLPPWLCHTDSLVMHFGLQPHGDTHGQRPAAAAGKSLPGSQRTSWQTAKKVSTDTGHDASSTPHPPCTRPPPPPPPTHTHTTHPSPKAYSYNDVKLSCVPHLCNAGNPTA